MVIGLLLLGLLEFHARCKLIEGNVLGRFLVFAGEVPGNRAREEDGTLSHTGASN